MSSTDRKFDVVLWGATGFTGKLVAEYLLERYGVGGELSWALAGRNRTKLEAVRSEIGHDTGRDAAAVPLIVADADDEASLASLVDVARVVCTTVGPYARHGSKLVAACARRGTHYCDLTGEVQWMRRMIDAHADAAKASGARIVHTCGFDSIPSDLGVFFLQNEMRRRHDTHCSSVKCRVVAFSGGFSGGTVASMFNMFEEAGHDPEVQRIMADPYALNPAGQRSGPDGPDVATPEYDPDFESWTGPFVMAAINTRVVRRTNALLDSGYGSDFRYDEAMLMGPGATGWMKAAALSTGLAATTVAGAIGPVRQLMARLAPSPGEGPSKQQREEGFFKIRFLGTHPQDPAKNLRSLVTGDRDPGYGSTAKMLGESAVCLARDELSVGGGIWTPAAAMGDALLRRLQANAGVSFTIDTD